MMSEKHLPVIAAPGEAQDDIRALAAAFSLQGWRYVDISRQERLDGIVARWPLLAELSTAASTEDR